MSAVGLRKNSDIDTDAHAHAGELPYADLTARDAEQDANAAEHYAANAKQDASATERYAAHTNVYIRAVGDLHPCQPTSKLSYLYTVASPFHYAHAADWPPRIIDSHIRTGSNGYFDTAT